MNNTHTGVERERVRGIKYDPKGFCLVNKKNGVATNEIGKATHWKNSFEGQGYQFWAKCKTDFHVKIMNSH